MHHFYHNFPRPRTNDSKEQICRKGLQILQAIKDIGFILAPEVLEWKQPLAAGTDRITTILQNRICFTELDRSEVAEHGKKFGPFSLEFEIDTLRLLGLLPVIYIPQMVGSDRNLSSAGISIVTQLGDARYTMSMLHLLFQHSDPDSLIKRYAPPGATNANVDEDGIINLQNSDPNDPTKIVQEFSVPMKTMQNILKFIGYGNSPFDMMDGALSGAQNLFYPTDDTYHNEPLAYYRQREWRLISGIASSGTPNSRLINEIEKAQLLNIDSSFWGRGITFKQVDKQIIFPRVEKTVVISESGGRPIHELISRVIVPSDVFSEAEKIFGDKVVANYD